MSSQQTRAATLTTKFKTVCSKPPSELLQSAYAWVCECLGVDIEKPSKLDVLLKLRADQVQNAEALKAEAKKLDAQAKHCSSIVEALDDALIQLFQEGKIDKTMTCDSGDITVHQNPERVLTVLLDDPSKWTNEQREKYAEIKYTIKKRTLKVDAELAEKVGDEFPIARLEPIAYHVRVNLNNL